MKIVVNGKEQELKEEKTVVADLLSINDVKMPEMVSVQVDGEFVARENFAGTILQEGNAVDFLYFMGGGS